VGPGDPHSGGNQRHEDRDSECCLDEASASGAHA
jgi:hypothetical protein